jgi:hypothetical protein
MLQLLEIEAIDRQKDSFASTLSKLDSTKLSYALLEDVGRSNRDFMLSFSPAAPV